MALSYPQTFPFWGHSYEKLPQEKVNQSLRGHRDQAWREKATGRPREGSEPRSETVAVCTGAGRRPSPRDVVTEGKIPALRWVWWYTPGILALGMLRQGITSSSRPASGKRRERDWECVAQSFLSTDHSDGCSLLEGPNLSKLCQINQKPASQDGRRLLMSSSGFAYAYRHIYAHT